MGAVRKRIAERREDLKKRRQLLEQGRQVNQEDLAEAQRTEEIISEERYVL